MQLVNILLEMMTLQNVLDTRIKEDKVVEFNIHRWRMALIDEIGELTHELKPSWCWWKDTVGTIDNKKVLQELVDVWHFALSINNHINTYDVEFLAKQIEKLEHTHVEHSHYLTQRAIKAVLHTHVLGVIELTYALGYNIHDVHEEYIRKNAINHVRQDNNY